jgi:hypothetical protein
MSDLSDKVRKFVEDERLHEEFGVTNAECVSKDVYRLTVPEQKERNQPVQLGMRMATSIGSKPQYSGSVGNGNVVSYVFKDGQHQIVVQLFYQKALPSDRFDFR